MFAVSYKAFGREGLIRLFGKSEGKILWPIVASIFVGLIPLSILLLNLHLLYSPVLIVLWLMFAAINPITEEIYWRGFLLENLPFSKKISVLYSTLFFVLSHPLMWGVFSIGNRSWMTLLLLSIMGIVWSVVYLKTKSLRWPTISHTMVNIFNLSVFVFLNLYIPPGM
jgi:membrane protease YdiL (CAAX protease family)